MTAYAKCSSYELPPVQWFCEIYFQSYWLGILLFMTKNARIVPEETKLIFSCLFEQLIAVRQKEGGGRKLLQRRSLFGAMTVGVVLPPDED